MSRMFLEKVRLARNFNEGEEGGGGRRRGEEGKKGKIS